MALVQEKALALSGQEGPGGRVTSTTRGGYIGSLKLAGALQAMDDTEIDKASLFFGRSVKLI